MLLLLAVGSAVRVIVFGILDRRPLFGGWEAPDLQRSMFYHYGLRGHLDWTFAEQVARDGFKPPLWYGGVPVLFGWKDSLSALDFLIVNALAMAVTVCVAYALARRLGGRRSGLVAAALTAFLPGIAWRIGMIGVEQTHMALLPLIALACLGLLHQTGRSWTHTTAVGAVLGLLVGVGLLIKWNLGAYVAAPLLLTAAFGLRRSVPLLAGLGTAAAVAAALFLAWMLPFADLQDILQQGAQGESDGQESSIYLRELASAFGPAGWLLLAVAAVAPFVKATPFVADAPVPGEPLTPQRPHALRWRDAVIVVSAVVGLLALHAAIPHKETRYLLPALPLLAVLVAVPLGRVPRIAAAGLALMALLSWAQPWISGTPDRFAWNEQLPAPIRDDYGIDAILAHPSLQARERTVVTFALSGPGRFPLLTFLHWELYGRNANPVLSRSDWDDVTSKACAFDLERSTHFLTSRPLDDQEQAALRSMGFEVTIAVRPRIADVPPLTLWALESGSAPRRGL